MPEKLGIEKLRLVINAILDHISDDLDIKEIPIEKDFYWNVDSESLFQTKIKPPHTDLGSLRDDWEFLTSILEDKDQAVPLMLTHAAPLLRYIGEKIAL